MLISSYRYKTIYCSRPDAVAALTANEQLEARPDDIVVAGFPESGTFISIMQTTFFNHSIHLYDWKYTILLECFI